MTLGTEVIEMKLNVCSADAKSHTWCLISKRFCQQSYQLEIEKEEKDKSSIIECL